MKSLYLYCEISQHLPDVWARNFAQSWLPHSESPDFPSGAIRRLTFGVLSEMSQQQLYLKYPDTKIIPDLTQQEEARSATCDQKSSTVSGSIAGFLVTTADL